MTAGLDTLPTEILQIIIGNAQPKDILSLRSTNKILRTNVNVYINTILTLHKKFLNSDDGCFGLSKWIDLENIPCDIDEIFVLIETNPIECLYVVILYMGAGLSSLSSNSRFLT